MSFVPKLLLIDANSIARAAFHQPELQSLTNDKGQCTGAIAGTLASLHKIVKEHPNAAAVFVWDGFCKWRRNILPEYKANRIPDLSTEEGQANAAKIADYERQREVLKEILSHTPLIQVTDTEGEADDLIGRICGRTRQDITISMYTSDSDYAQLLSPRVQWNFYRKKVMITLADLSSESNGLPDGAFDSPLQYLQCKAIAGDSSDNIPGLEKFGLATARKYHQRFGSFEAFWDQVDKGEVKLSGKLLQNLAKEETRLMYERNLMLMDLTDCPAVPASRLQMSLGNNIEVGLAATHEQGIVGQDYAFATLAGLKKMNELFSPLIRNALTQR